MKFTKFDFSKLKNDRKLRKIVIIGLILLVVCGGVYSLTKDESVPLNIVKGETTLVEQDKVYLSMEYEETNNPLVSKGEGIKQISNLIYDGLFTFDENLKPTPALADSYKYQDDSLVVVLQKRVKWHDGEGFTADDVIFTYNAIKAVGSKGPYYEKADKISSIEKVNNRKIRVNFKDETDMGLENLSFPILPEHRYDSSYALANIRNNFKPVGTGMYKVKKIEDKEKIILRPFKSYRGTKPKSQVFVTIFEGNGNITKLVESGNISVAPDSRLNRETKIQKKGIDIIDYPTNELVMLGFNMEKPQLLDVNLRKAIATALDRRDIIENAYVNCGVVTDSLYPNQYAGTAKAKEAYRYNLDDARAILKKSHYKDVDNDGVLEDREKKNLSINILVNSEDSCRLAAAEILEEDLESIDIEATITAVPEKSFLSSLKAGKFDVYIGKFVLGEGMDLRPLLHTEGEFNFGKYTNLKMDENLDKLKSGITPEMIVSTIEEIKKGLNEELPIYPICYTTSGLIESPVIRGDIKPNFVNVYKGIETWFCEVEQRAAEEDEE